VGFTGIDLSFPRNQYYAAGSPGYISTSPSETFVLLDGDLRPVITTRRFAVYAAAFMNNYQTFYRRASEFYSLSHGIIPLRYRYGDFVNLLTNNRENNNG
jgi:hypothetical protein